MFKAAVNQASLSDLRRKLERIPKKERNKGFKQAIRETVKTVWLPSVKADAPHDRGDLRKSIKVRTAVGDNGKRLPRGTTGVGVFQLGDKAWHGKFQEFGTKHIAPQPYMYPTFKQKSEAAVQLLRRLLKQKLNL